MRSHLASSAKLNLYATHPPEIESAQLEVKVSGHRETVATVTRSGTDLHGHSPKYNLNAIHPRERTTTYKLNLHAVPPHSHMHHDIGRL